MNRTAILGFTALAAAIIVFGVTSCDKPIPPVVAPAPVAIVQPPPVVAAVAPVVVPTPAPAAVVIALPVKKPRGCSRGEIAAYNQAYFNAWRANKLLQRAAYSTKPPPGC